MGNSEARLHKRAVGKQKAKLDRSAKAIETRIEKLEKKKSQKKWKKFILIYLSFTKYTASRY
ncbi:hypothetical protein MUB16_21035 [Priestia sp. OVL9]|nr:hypothetical protein [Priestia sp. OVL9]